MPVNSKHLPNVTCGRCRFRHPASLTCEQAREAAEAARKPAPCLGCHGPTESNGDCPRCDERAAALIQSSHWPLEVSVSPRALAAIEIGIQMMLDMAPSHPAIATANGRVQTELSNVAANIRSHLQHVENEFRRARKAAPKSPEKDPLLL
jgi:hypothetical protein